MIKKSKRSYYLNEFDTISSQLANHLAFFGTNYKVFFVPQPVTEPMGKVLSGVATFSRYSPVSSIRYSLPGDFGFPTQLFYLDRCFIVNRYLLTNGKELIIINTHMEAFDAGEIRKARWNILKVLFQGNTLKAITLLPVVTGINALPHLHLILRRTR